MDRKTGAVAVLFVVAGIFAHGTPFGSAENPDPRPAGVAASSESQPATPSRGAASGAKPGATSQFGPRPPVCAYLSDKRTSLSLNGIENDQEPKDKDQIVKQFCFDTPVGQTFSRKVAIATVPDPELTPLSLLFDRNIESITWAAADGDLGDERYLFNGYWFPWRSPAGPEAGSAKGETD